MTIAQRLRNSWAILPASRVLFNKNKVTIREASNEWAAGIILVCRKTNYMGEKEGFLFINSCGHSDASCQHYADQIGKSQACHHDQNFSSIGPVVIVNVVRYEQTATKYTEEAALPISSDNFVDSAPLYVFK